MTQADSDILLLADDAVAAELAALGRSNGFVHHREPYDAMAEFARRPYRAVVLAHPLPDFAALVRAFGRLRTSAKRFALCSPAGEAELRISGPGELDGYFVHPPAPEEMEAIFGTGPAPAEHMPAPETTGGELSITEVAELVESAGTIDSLAEGIARLVGEWIAGSVRWAGVGDDEAAGRELILLDDDPPRILLADEAETIGWPAREKLISLQALVGSLAANARRTDALHRLAITDHLTGAYNRRYFYHFTDQLLARAGKHRFRVTLLLYDIDDFKRYNDTYGHAAGDEILRETAELMGRTTRDHDMVARIGGDEFAVLFWDAEPPRQADSQHPADAYVLAQRFVRALAKHEFPSLGPEATGMLTISGGLATFPWDGKTCRELLRQADKGLQAAKASGKSAIHLVGQDEGRGEGGPEAPA